MSGQSLPRGGRTAEEGARPDTSAPGARLAGSVGPDGGITVEVLAAALMGLAGVGPVRCRGLLRALLPGRSPSQAWAAFLQGACAGAIISATGGGSWVGEARRQARAVDPAAIARLCARRSIGILATGSTGYPPEFTLDPEGPAAIFFRGSADVLAQRPRVAMIGTRSATGGGCDVARDLARGLARRGVVVVSGMAIGIDAAAHAGALEAGRLTCGKSRGDAGGRLPEAAPTIAVLAGGVDVVYPRRHGPLYDSITRTGIAISEAPPGTPPEAWRFPVRNRLMAMLADVVVVVESADKGGSMRTVEAALNRGVTVMAVPGSVRNPAARGTNSLLADGCPPCRDVDDVVAALSLMGRPCTRPPAPVAPPAQSRLDPDEEDIIRHVGWEPTAVGEVVARSGVRAARVIAVLERLAERGRVRCGAGWWERVG